MARRNPGRAHGILASAGWERYTEEQKQAYRGEQFPTLASILDGLQAAHAPVVQFLETEPAASICEKRRAAWGEDNTLRWIFWHLVEHDQHHRGQVYTRLRLLGHNPPSTFPRQGVMGSTPAAAWKAGEEEVWNVIPFWDQVRSSLREAVGSLPERDLAFRPAEGLASIHDVILHLFTWEDFLIRENLQGQMSQGWWKIEGWFWKSNAHSLAQDIGARSPTTASLIEGLDAVRDATKSFLNGLTPGDLAKTHDTPWGPETLHHTLWYAREHMCITARSSFSACA